MIKFFKILIIFLLPLSLKSQVCQGNLGDNIFTDGDFGSGTANISTNNPGLAPGYSYTTSPPPVDGWFTIANSTNWAGLYPTWLNIRDASDDPNGYMMIINASFDPGLFYDQTVTGLCENTLYEFSADAINLIRNGVPDHIAPNITFLLDDVPVTSSGDIAQDEQWHQYGVLFTTGPGQTSVKLSIRNNAPGGNGNDLALDNISFRTCGDPAQILPKEIENICENGNPIDLNATIVGNQYPNPAVQWQESFDGGLTWQDIAGATDLTYQHTNLAGGTYYYRYLLAGSPQNLLNLKCRIVSNVKLIYVQPKFWTTIDTICEGIDYFNQGELITESGIYVDSLTSSLGCDSVVTLDLTIVPDPGIAVDFQASSPACSEDTGGTIIIENIANGYPPYEVLLDDVSIGNNSNFSNLPVATYDFLVTDKFGCSFSRSIDLSPPNEFAVDVGDDISVTLGDQVTVNASGTQTISEYSWTPSEAVDCDDCSSVSFLPRQNMTVVLYAVSDIGCKATDSLDISVLVEKRVFIPSAFSPNNDGINDFFSINAQVPNVSLIRKFLVFDRWGNLLFENKDFEPGNETDGWNGEFRGKPLEVGLYVFFAEIEFLNGDVDIFEGDITLLR